MGPLFLGSAVALRTLLAIATLLVFCGEIGHAEEAKSDDPFRFQQVPSQDPSRTREARIQAVLESEMELDYFETPLIEAMNDLGERLEIPIKIDRLALDELGIDSETPISSTLRGISLKSALRLILRDLELTYLIRDEVLLITTHDKAADFLVTETYDVSDLIIATKSDVDLFIETITCAVSPDSWAEVGGAGSTTALGPVLVVLQTQEAQAEIESLLDRLRTRCANPVGDWSAAQEAHQPVCPPSPGGGAF